MKEEWKPVVGYENSYEVSNLGRVRSLDRSWSQLSKHGSAYTYHKKGKMLRPGPTAGGYPSVALGKGNTKLVHRLVAEAFIGECPPGKEVCHIDGDRTNPVVDNLRYGTRLDNINDSRAHGTFSGRYKSQMALSCKQMRIARYAYGFGSTVKQVAGAFNVSEATLLKVVRFEHASLY